VPKPVGRRRNVDARFFALCVRAAGAFPRVSWKRGNYQYLPLE
jgi:hypothetical protein